MGSGSWSTMDDDHFYILFQQRLPKNSSASLDSSEVFQTNEAALTRFVEARTPRL